MSTRRTGREPRALAVAPEWFDDESVVGDLGPTLHQAWALVQAASNSALDDAFHRLMDEATTLPAAKYLPKTARGMRTWLGRVEFDLYINRVEQLLRLAVYVDSNAGARLVREALQQRCDPRYLGFLATIAVRYAWTAEESMALLRAPLFLGCDLRSPYAAGVAYDLGAALAAAEAIPTSYLEERTRAFVSRSPLATLDALWLCCAVMLTRDPRGARPIVVELREAQLALLDDPAARNLVTASFAGMLRALAP